MASCSSSPGVTEAESIILGITEWQGKVTDALWGVSSTEVRAFSHGGEKGSWESLGNAVKDLCFLTKGF